MKKVLTLALSGIIGISFAQNNLHDAKVVGKFDLGDKEVTAVFDKETGCTHKSHPHKKGLFVANEDVKLDVTNQNNSEIIKPNLPERVYVGKNCDDNDEPLSRIRITFSLSTHGAPGNSCDGKGKCGPCPGVCLRIVFKPSTGDLVPSDFGEAEI